MTLWQDQSPRQPGTGAAGGSGRGVATDADRPRSRREARERERQAAEELAEGREHPSGVVDFGSYDFGTEFATDQVFGEQDTADIWASLARRSQQPPTAQPLQPPAPESALPPVTDALMDRVRDAVLRREREADVLPTAIAPIVGAPPVTGLPSRRDLRRELASATTEDGMPAAWFSDRGAVPAAFAGEPDDLPPTVAMSMPALDRAELTAQAPMTAPVGLPRGFAPVVGDDVLAFSSIAPVAAPEPEVPAGASADAAFSAPEPVAAEPVEPKPWAQRHQAWSVEPAEEREPWIDPEAERTSPGRLRPLVERGDAQVTATPAWSDAPETPWPMPPAIDQQPYSEPTDLAGFEALIKRARGAQPQPASQPQPSAQAPAAAAKPWQEPDEQSPFARAVAAAHGASNALVLPDDPTPDLTQAVNSTGDIFITGSMKLPRSLSTTGATEEHYDGPEVDRLFEAAHNEPAAGVSPVRASRAVGGSPAGRPMVGRRQRSNVLPTVLAVVAGAMAVGVLVLLVGSWVLRLF